jgi:uncharacterized protein
VTIDWVNFTPWTALAGGALIGLAASLLLVAAGRIMGVSGILAGLINDMEGDTAWRMAFLAGLLIAPTLMLAFGAFPAPKIESSGPILIAAGLLVGFGTRLGSGCTSGHGICGLARLSPRSLAATLCFVAAGMITVFVIRHGIG